MGGRGQHMLQGAQLFGHEKGQLLHGAGVDHDHQVKGPAHQIHALDLLKAVDALGNGVKALVPLGRDPDLNQGFHLFLVQLIPIDERRIFDDNLLGLQAADDRFHLFLRMAGHDRDLIHRGAGVVE